jgi:hypothetical protein
MRRYPDSVELQIRLQQQVKDWTRSGLLLPAQGAQLQSDLRLDLRRTGLMLRAGLAVFTLISVVALIVLIFITLDVRNDAAISLLALAMGLISFWAADVLVARFRLYRYGIEEAFAAASVGLCGIAAGVIVDPGTRGDGTAIAAALLACAVLSAAAYVRFGFQYAAVAAVVFVAAFPLPFERFGNSTRHLLVALLFGLALTAASAIMRSSRSDVRKEDASLVAAAALVGMYLAVNVHATSDLFYSYGSTVAPWFKWSTYVLTWVIPAVALWRAIVNRDRKLIIAGLAIALVTLITNKPYLGRPHQPWDPMLFGILLIGVAVGLRRWLAAGPNGERNGFTSARILIGDNDRVEMASLASAAVHLGTDRHAPAPPQEPSQFRGGRSGGGGAGSDFRRSEVRPRNSEVRT